MFKKLIFYISFSFLIICNYSELSAEVKNFIPLKKPLLDKITLENKLTQGILKPKPKPVNNVENKDLSKKIIKPKNKPIKENNNKITKELTSKKSKETTKKITKKKFRTRNFLNSKKQTSTSQKSIKCR